LTIENGTFTINSQDDGLHSNGSVTIHGGEFTINAGDDGIHADYDCTLEGDYTIDIQNSYEGVEGANIYINGEGFLNIVASDDGINASDKTSTSTSNSGGGFGGGFGFGNATGYLEINGGSLVIDASGDGIDSNGDMIINGGDIVVYGTTSGGDGALDCGDNNNVINITGGTLVAGGAQQMFELPDDSSTQNSIYCLDLSASSNTTVILVDEDNNIVSSITDPKAMQSVVFSSSDIVTGKTYTIYKDVTLTDDEVSQGKLSDSSFTDGDYQNGTLVGSVEVTETVSQIGEGSTMGNGFGGGGQMGGGNHGGGGDHSKGGDFDSNSNSQDDDTNTEDSQN
jgi:hypothetical protein